MSADYIRYNASSQFHSALQLKTWSSAIYDHYHQPEILTTTSGVKYVFACKKNPSIKVTRARHDESTSNLNRHADSCNPNVATTATMCSISYYANGTSYNPRHFRLKMSLWIAKRARPFAIVEDPEFIELLTILNDKVVTPSCSTVSRDIQEIFSISQRNVRAVLMVGIENC